MAEIRQILLILVLAGALGTSVVGNGGPKFFPDDPLETMPSPLPVTVAHSKDVNPVLDFMAQSKTSHALPATPGAAINTLGDVPDSEWFTNRHGKHRMSRAELQQGPPGPPEGPTPPFEVTAGKRDGIMAGFRMKDSKGRNYFVKGDPVGYPELATAAEAIVSRFFYAIGYNTPKNEIVNLKLSDLSLSPNAKVTLVSSRSRKMTWQDLHEFVKEVSHDSDGSFRVVASLSIDGEGVGPFRYEGTRPGDPNDIVAHENRRDLRGLYVFAAWLNHTDAKPANTLDTIVEGNGIRFIRHHLLDFGSALGSDGNHAKDPRLGHAFALTSTADAVKQVLTLGVIPQDWEQVEYRNLPGIGNFEWQSFDPDHWTSNYPNPAFLRRLPDDDFWAAKQVMAFTDEDIRAIVETGKYSDPRSTEYMVATLAERRNKIGRTFFTKLLPLDRFRIENSELLFDDLAAQFGFAAPRHYHVKWFRFNNTERTQEAIDVAESPQLPLEVVQAAPGFYFAAVISTLGGSLKPVSVYVRKQEGAYKVVGIDRAL